MDIGINDEDRKAVCDALQRLLADEFLLYTKYRNYHWNIKAPNFSELHEFYENQYNELAVFIDDIAERIRTLGHISKGKLADFLELTQLEEQDYTTKAEEQLSNLIADHETIIKYLRSSAAEFGEKYNDSGSAGFAEELMEKHEKMRWMLDSFIT
jgi:starvation-inducible DNA-binding protein